MEIKIESQTENKLLGRKEIIALLSFTGPTPKRNEMKTAICTKIGVDPDLAVLREVESSFGVKQLRVRAHIYQNAEMLKRTEPQHILVRHGIVEKKEGKLEEAKKKEG